MKTIEEDDCYVYSHGVLTWDIEDFGRHIITKTFKDLEIKIINILGLQMVSRHKIYYKICHTDKFTVVFKILLFNDKD